MLVRTPGRTMLTPSVLLFVLAALIAFSYGSYYEYPYCPEDEQESWSYHGKHNGPSEWGKLLTDCNGTHQSPIAIYSDDTQKDPSLGYLKMESFSKPVTQAKIENNGYTVVITPNDGVDRFIIAEGKHFSLEQFHFHWGTHHDRGSEHMIDGHRFSVEAHFILRSDDGQFGVISSFFEETPSNNPAFDPIDEALPHILFKGESVPLKHPVLLDDFVPSNPAPFYRYSGSLTPPVCKEDVVWSLLKGTNPLGKAQLSRLRNLNSIPKNETDANCKIRDNFRPIQPLNCRTVYSST